jgi:outer membrane lipoprotein carrier protein
MKYLSPALLLALAIGVTASGATNEPKANLDELLHAISTLTADVTQLIVESDGGVLEESEIRMALKKPDGFFWETLSPFPELIVTNGVQLWNYQPDLEQVVIEPWDTSRSELAAQLLNGQTEHLAEEYTITQSETTDTDSREFRLVPLAADSVYEEITISFLNQSLDMIYLNNKNGERTVWQFSDLQQNQPLEDSLFEFVPPAGIEIISNTYADAGRQ